VAGTVQHRRVYRRTFVSFRGANIPPRSLDAVKTHERRDGKGVISSFTKPRAKRGSQIMSDQPAYSCDLARFVECTLEVDKALPRPRINKNVILKLLAPAQAHADLSDFRIPRHLAILACLGPGYHDQAAYKVHVLNLKI
jgi:hypothetical protein